MSKGSSKCLTFNANARATQNYYIIEDIAQSPYAMLVLEVLQSFPTQRSELLIVIREVDPNSSLLIMFDTSSFIWLFKLNLRIERRLYSIP